MPITDEDYIQQYDDDNEKPPTPPTEEPEQVRVCTVNHSSINMQQFIRTEIILC